MSLTGKPVRAYVAHGMSNRPWDAVVNESFFCAQILAENNISAIDPVDIEKIPHTDDTTPIPIRTDAEGKIAWSDDKKAIRSCHVLIDITPHLKSEGVAHEIGLMRYGYWKPVIRILKPGTPKPMIPYFDDDVLVYSLYEAAELINERWGTWWKRFKWRINMYRRCRLKALKHELEFWFQ